MTVDEAIPIAIENVRKLFHGTDYRLEEVELNDDGSFDITISYRAVDGKGAMFPFEKGGFAEVVRAHRAVIGIDPTRHYKAVEITKDGQMRSVRIATIVVG